MIDQGSSFIGVSGQKPRIAPKPSRQFQIGDTPRCVEYRSSPCFHSHGIKFNRTALI